MPESLRLYHCQSIRGEQVEPLEIRIETPAPTITSDRWVDDYKAIYDAQATMLFNALRRHLPGGTLARLMIKQLEHEACLLKVAMPGREATVRLDVAQAVGEWAKLNQSFEVRMQLLKNIAADLEVAGSIIWPEVR